MKDLEQLPEEDEECYGEEEREGRGEGFYHNDMQENKMEENNVRVLLERITFLEDENETLHK